MGLAVRDTENDNTYVVADGAIKINDFGLSLVANTRYFADGKLLTLNKDFAPVGFTVDENTFIVRTS